MTENDFDKDIENDEFADEFDFVEDDHLDDLNMAPKGGSQPPAPNKNKNSLIMYGSIIAVLIVGGYFWFTHGSSDTPNKAIPKSPLPSPQVPPSSGGIDPTTTPSLPALPTPGADSSVDFNQAFDNASGSQDQLSNALPQQSKTFEQMQRDLKGKGALPDEINATLDSISEEMTLNVNQMKHLETTITSLASTVEQLNKSISAMDNRVLGLTETVDGLAQDLSNVKKVISDEDLDLTANNNVRMSGNKKHNINNASPEYTVHAIIPGRAWLKNSNGQITTVTEGDKVGDFGTVAVIDAANGVVRTSSGITFR